MENMAAQLILLPFHMQSLNMPKKQNESQSKYLYEYLHQTDLFTIVLMTYGGYVKNIKAWKLRIPQ